MIGRGECGGERRVRRRTRQRAGAGVTAIGGAAAYALLARSRQLRWGASDDEADGRLPGDELIPHPDLSATRAIAVRTSADKVWPWIAQLGQGRGGFYSYDFLENLAGCDIHSADRVIPEWQAIRVGDEVKLAPRVALEVAALEPGRALVLRGGVPMGKTPPPYDFSWAAYADSCGGPVRSPAATGASVSAFEDPEPRVHIARIHEAVVLDDAPHLGRVRQRSSL